MEAIERFNEDVGYHIHKKMPPELEQPSVIQYHIDYINPDLAWSRSEKDFASACVYLACREEGLPYTIEDFLEPDQNKDAVMRLYRDMCSKLKIMPPRVDPIKFAERIHNNIGGVPEKVLERAKLIIEENKESGKQTNTIAASAYYRAAKIEGVTITQSLIGKEANVSEVTIRNTYRNLNVP